MAELNGDGKIRGVRMPSRLNIHGVLIRYGPVWEPSNWTTAEPIYSTVEIPSR